MNALILDETKNYCEKCGNCEAVMPGLLAILRGCGNRITFSDGYLADYGDILKRAANSCHLELLRVEEGVR